MADLSAELFGQPAAPTQSRGQALAGELFGAPKPQIGWGDVPLSALKNAIPSAGNFVSGVAQAVVHPINTIGSLVSAGAGGINNLMPQSVDNFGDKLFGSKGRLDSVKTADAIGGFYKDRYGSSEGLKNTLATDPVGIASDVAALLSGGAGVAAKVPGLTKAAGMMATASKYTNPINAATYAASKAAPALGNGIANAIGGLGTHTGGESIKQAFRSGMEGGDSATSFADNMRGNVPMTDVLDAAKQNLQAMGQQKSAAYRQGMAQVSGDKSVLDFSNIDNAINDAANAVTFKGQIKNTKAAQVQQDIADAVRQWKGLDPAEYHTPEGFDALKQKIGGIVESIPFEEKTAGMVGSKIYNAVKSEIVNQAPVYADVMKGYTDASDQIREIEKSLSLGGKASVDTAMRKLQSLTRNNANTNYGNRLDLAKTLEQQGGQQIMPALAGQALSSMTPRGLGGAVAGGLGLGGYAVGGPALAIPMLAAQSPRLMGESALLAGRGAGAVNKAAQPVSGLLGNVGVPAEDLANYLYQFGRLPQQ